MRSLVIILVVLISITVLLTPVSVDAQNPQDPVGTLEVVDDGNREKLQETKDQITDQIEQYQSEAMTRVNQRVTSHLELIIQYLGNLQTKLSDHRGLTDTQRNTILSNATSLVTQFTAFKNQIADATTVSEVKAVGTQARSLWQETQVKRFQYVGLIVAGRYTYYLQRIEATAAKVEAKVNDLASRGLDVGAAQAALTEYKGNLNKTKAKINEAISVFNAITTVDQGNTAFQQGLGLLREAKQLTGDTVSSLRKLILAVKLIV